MGAWGDKVGKIMSEDMVLLAKALKPIILPAWGIGTDQYNEFIENLPDELDEYKRIARIEDLIEADTSSADVKQSKPHPDIFEAALGKLGGIALNKIVTVGDTPYDAEGATNANMRIIGLLSGGWTEERLRQAGCIEVYRHPADLLAHYEHSVLHSTTESR